jgi:DNA (cytosine-5)-methyltransferase 1
MGLVIDLFAGGGGASLGIAKALGIPVHAAINHSPVAMAVHKRNHPETKHYTSDVWEVHPAEVTKGQPVDLLWLSPDCRHFSNAKGDVPRSPKVRSLAWVALRWAKIARPNIIMLENLREFEGWGPLGSDGKPDKRRKGQTFKCWLTKLKNQGYEVAWRVLDSALYGSRTSRKRLFLVARRDGLPIVFPEPTHGPGRKRVRTAFECIDWSIPCPSIFGRKRPLKPKTLWRIAQGIKRFVLENPRPFVVIVNHGKHEARVEQLELPLSTITASRRGHALIVPTLQQSGYGERPGQRARVPGLDKPLGACVNGQKHALVAAFLSKHIGDPQRTDGGGGIVLGQELDRPMPTVMPRNQTGLAAVCLAKFRGTHNDQPGAADVTGPLPTISAGGIHVAEVRAFLSVYYGSDGTTGQGLLEPMRTITTKHRLGIVTVEGVDYQITDIGFRMLSADELLRAQFYPYDEEYDIRPARTSANKVWLIGNSVVPLMAETLVRANLPGCQGSRRAA